MAKALQAVIIDDTAVYRKIMASVLEDIEGIENVGEFSDGRVGLIGIQQLHPELVFLDVEMPGMNGLEVLNTVKRDFPDIGVIMVSSADRTQVDITVRALEAGAIDFVSKPAEGSIEENAEYLKKKIKPLISIFLTRKNLSRIKKLTQKYNLETDKVESREKASEPDKPYKFGLVTIGISTGGPFALGELLPKIPTNFPVPILIVQHMPPKFTASLAESLTKKSQILIKEVENGERLQAGKAYLAAGGHHMVLKKDSNKYLLEWNEGPSEHGCKPSVDVLFRSIAENFDGDVLSIVMTGMGSDGTEGVRAMKEKNCYCLIQDEASCVVYGMPKIVEDNKLADEILPLNRLADRIVELVTKK